MQGGPGIQSCLGRLGHSRVATWGPKSIVHGLGGGEGDEGGAMLLDPI